MTSADAYGIAQKLAGFQHTNTQFYIGICTALVGWIVLGETVKAWEPFGCERITLVILFGAASAGLIFAQIDLNRRVNSAIGVAKYLFLTERPNPAESGEDLKTGKLFAKASHWFIIIPMIGAFLVLSAFVLFARGDPSRKVAAKPNISLSVEFDNTHIGAGFQVHIRLPRREASGGTK